MVKRHSNSQKGALRLPRIFTQWEMSRRWLVCMDMTALVLDDNGDHGTLMMTVQELFTSRLHNSGKPGTKDRPL